MIELLCLDIDGTMTDGSIIYGYNSYLDLHSADFGIFEASQTPSLASSPKIPKNHESQAESPSVVDSATQNLVKNNSCKTHPLAPSAREGEIVDSAGLRPNPHLLFASQKVSKNQSHEALASATARSVVGGGGDRFSRGRGATSHFERSPAFKLPPPLAKMRVERISSESKNGRNGESFGESRNSKDSRESHDSHSSTQLIGVLGGDSPLSSNIPPPFGRGQGGGVESQITELAKAFNVKDGLGIAYWCKVLGRKVAIITGRESEIINFRAKELGIELIFTNIRDKGAVVRDLKERFALDSSQIATVGDDLNDIPMFRESHLNFVPNDCADALKSLPHTTILNAKGGKGAVREAIEIILKKESLYEAFVSQFV